MYNVQIRELMMRKSLMMIVNHITTFQIVSFVNDYPGANRFQDTKTNILFTQKISKYHHNCSLTSSLIVPDKQRVIGCI